MFEIEVSVAFTFTHFLKGFGEEFSRPHPHTWDVTLILGTQNLDGRGVSVDFLEVKKKLFILLQPYNGKLLNQTDLPIASQPTAEHIALWVAAELDKHYPGLISSVAVGSSIGRVRFVTPLGKSKSFQ